ncbi:unnamed protein product, partial [Choristocarpus tenellus]
MFLLNFCAAILEQHPNVNMALRKELHFFDSNAKIKMGLNRYAQEFPRMNESVPLENITPFIVGEATPFYLASRNACSNIKNMLPNVRLIILVREPIKRAYSEYQMKVRRVEEQAEMIELVKGNANVLYDCFNRVLPS